MLYTTILNQNRDFQSCYRRGVCIPSKLVVLYALPNKLPVSRLGITAGKKLGGAVVRSRLRRVIRQAWRENELAVPVGVDVVIVARHALIEASSVQLSHYLAEKGIPALCEAIRTKRK